MKLKKHYENIIIGSGFGGAFAAHALASAGKEVLIIERGKWVTRDDSCWDEYKLHITDHLYRGKTPFYIDQNDKGLNEIWTDDTVGGMSTMYGAVSFRMREEDFSGAPMPEGKNRDKTCAWPYGYSELEPYYKEAEENLGIAGISGTDITEPPRTSEYLHRPHETLSPPSKKIWDAARSLGYHPFFLPMAINFSGKYGKEKCILCPTCDHYLCKIEAKNDLSVTLLPEAIKKGATLMPDTRVLKINTNGDRATGVTIVNQGTGEETEIKAKNIICAGGAVSSPHLLLVSGIDNRNTGHYLMRHANGVVAGVFPHKTNPVQMLQKQIAISDFYYGSKESSDGPDGVWGLIQDVSSIGPGVIKQNAPFGLKNIAAFMSDYLINLLCIAEDMPRYENRIYADPAKKDIYGMPDVIIKHRYSQRDIAARKALYKKARGILRRAGALMHYTMPIETLSHAIGTCRMGDNAETSVVDPQCRVWGMKNLYVMDGSVMPSGGSVNPSLTIGALSLKAARELAGQC